MADTGFAMALDSDAVIKMLSNLPSGLRQRVTQLVEGSAIDVQREMRIAAPVAVTGHLRRSINYKFDTSNFTAVIAPDVEYARSVEYGSPPHWVSVAPGSSLRAWAEQKGINPYALRNSIKSKGTVAHPFVRPVYDAMKPKVESYIATGITNLIAEVTR